MDSKALLSPIYFYMYLCSMNNNPISEVYLMDCVAGMKEYPDKFFDLAICDPPYGIGDEKLTSGGTWAKKYKKGEASWDVRPPDEYFLELFRVSKNQIIWGGNYFSELPECRCFLIWDKVTYMNTMADCEFAWTSFDKNAKIFRNYRNTSEKRVHITQKPIQLYEWLLKNYAEKGNRILDTHLGSGSSRIAAYKMSFDFYGFEIDPDYFSASEKRFKEAISMPLFDAGPVSRQLKLV
jgi:site-specific DNA-methyltransferase (adenine-specific)